MSSTDRLEVIETVYRYAAGIDHRDWPAYRAVLTDEVTIDYSSYRADSIGPMAADAWVARAVGLFPGLDASQHTISNPRVSLAGDSATCESYVRAEHALDGELYTLGGFYTHRLVHDGDGWRINHITLRMAWSQGDRELLTRARQNAAAADE